LVSKTADMATRPTTYQPIGAEELVFGLVYGAGAETETFEALLRESMGNWGYDLRLVHLSRYFPALLEQSDFQREAPNATRELQNMGDAIRKKTGRNEIAADLAVFLIASMRARSSSTSPVSLGSSAHSSARRKLRRSESSTDRGSS